MKLSTLRRRVHALFPVPCTLTLFKEYIAILVFSGLLSGNPNGEEITTTIAELLVALAIVLAVASVIALGFSVWIELKVGENPIAKTSMKFATIAIEAAAFIAAIVGLTMIWK